MRILDNKGCGLVPYQVIYPSCQEEPCPHDDRAMTIGSTTARSLSHPIAIMGDVGMTVLQLADRLRGEADASRFLEELGWGNG